jgi:hypothetical protein
MPKTKTKHVKVTTPIVETRKILCANASVVRRRVTRRQTARLPVYSPLACTPPSPVMLASQFSTTPFRTVKATLEVTLHLYTLPAVSPSTLPGMLFFVANGGAKEAVGEARHTAAVLKTSPAPCDVLSNTNSGRRRSGDTQMMLLASQMSPEAPDLASFSVSCISRYRLACSLLLRCFFLLSFLAVIAIHRLLPRNIVVRTRRSATIFVDLSFALRWSIAIFLGAV